MEDLKYRFDYIRIVEEEKSPERKTCNYSILNKEGLTIGHIKWYGPWRKFCFYPVDQTIWDNKCLVDLISILNDLNDKYIKRKKSKDE